MSRKTFVITGATGGLGQALSAEARARGHFVIALQRVPALSLTGDGRVVVVDLSDAEDASRKIQSDQAFIEDGVDVLLNCAGMAAVRPLFVSEPKRVRELFEVNVISPTALTSALWPALALRRGCVINIGSIASRVTLPLLGPYSASKSALLAITDAVRLEGRPFGIRACYVELGNVRTGIHEKAMVAAALDLRGQAQLGPLQIAMERAAARATVLSLSAMRPDKVARRIIDLALKPRTPRIAVVGRDAWIRYALGALVPHSLLERVVLRIAGLRSAP